MRSAIHFAGLKLSEYDADKGKERSRLQAA